MECLKLLFQLSFLKSGKVNYFIHMTFNTQPYGIDQGVIVLVKIGTCDIPQTLKC